MRRLFLVLSCVCSLVPAVPARAGFELDTRKLWPMIPSGQMQALILEYHLIEDPPEGAKHPDLYVKEETFVRHLSMLREAGLRCISFKDAIDQFESGTYDSSSVIVTFDDGYRDNLNAARTLESLGHGGTFYIPTFMVGRSYPLDKLYHMSWEDIRSISKMGFEIGAHSVHHINLQNCKPERLEYEISGSLNAIHKETGVKPTTFSIPMGKYTTSVLGELDNYGLRGCVTSNYGYMTAFNISNAPRIKIKEETGMRSVIMLYLMRNLKNEGEIGPGARSPRVRSFRTMLTRIGYPLRDSDEYDLEMVNAVKEFQMYFHLEESGILNTVTIDRIISDFISLAVSGI